MSDEKMRAEFEAWASIYGFDLQRSVDDWYFCLETRSEWITWRVAYQAGRKAVQRESEEWSKSVNKRFIEMENKPEGKDE